MRSIITLAAALCAFLASGAPGDAQSAAAQADPVILVVDGKTGDGKPVSFTLGEIAAMAGAKIITHTPWHDGSVTFEGVPVTALLDKVGVKGETLDVVALDKYSVEIPIADLQKYHAVMAYKLDGKIMDIADKGPLFIVWPYDSDPYLATEKFYSRSPWQIAHMTIE